MELGVGVRIGHSGSERKARWMDSPLFDLPLTTDAAPDLALEALLDDRHELIGRVSDWAQANRTELERGLDRRTWRHLASAGFQRITSPVDEGGLGCSTVQAMLVFEGLGHGCTDNGLVFALSSQVFATQSALRSAAAPAQRERFLPSLFSGDAFGAFAMSEPDAGSDSSAIRTTARRVDAHAEDPKHPDAVYEVSGEKCWITLGPVADTIVLFATTDPALGKWGITAFVIDTDQPGVDCGPEVKKVGLHQSPFGSITFDGLRLTVADRLGPQGAGGAIFTKAVEGERALLFAGQLGASRRVLEQTIEHVRSENSPADQFGSKQDVHHRIADGKLDLEMARLLVYKAAALNDRGRSVGMASALAKLQTSEMAVTTALEAVSMRGLAGTLAGPSASELDDALGGLAYSGTSDIQRMIIARLLRVDAPLRPKGTPRQRIRPPLGESTSPNESLRPNGTLDPNPVQHHDRTTSPGALT